MPTPLARRVLIAIPAFNEKHTLQAVVEGVSQALPGVDRLVIDDGSEDGSQETLRSLKVATATHLCNLGYGRAVQTAITFALRHQYDALITLDADGQHRPDQVPQMLEAFWREDWDYLIGSRYVTLRRYADAPPPRRLGMLLFSVLTKLFTGRRIYDTTSGLRILRRSLFEPLTHWHFVDFHAETIVFLSRLGFRVGEFPITVDERQYGKSMYSLWSVVVYPFQTLLMLLLGIVEATISRRRSS